MSISLRSPHDLLAGYVHLPRFIDKARAHLAGELPPGYQPNFTRGLDGRFLEFTGISAQAFIEAVRGAKDDAAVAAWVQAHARPHTPADIEAWNESMRNFASPPERFQQRLKELGFERRTDIRTSFDLIDADEGRPLHR